MFSPSFSHDIQESILTGWTLGGQGGRRCHRAYSSLWFFKLVSLFPEGLVPFTYLGGLNEMSLIVLDLNTWSAVGNTVSEGLGGVALLECHGGLGYLSLKTNAISILFSSSCL